MKETPANANELLFEVRTILFSTHQEIGNFWIECEKFIDVTKKLPGIKAKGRKKTNSGKCCGLREPRATHYRSFEFENGTLRTQNIYCWKYN